MTAADYQDLIDRGMNFENEKKKIVFPSMWMFNFILFLLWLKVGDDRVSIATSQTIKLLVAPATQSSTYLFYASESLSQNIRFWL